MLPPDAPPTLLFCAPAPVTRANGGWHLDVKFVSGMQRHVADWGGKIVCILWEGQDAIPFGRIYQEEDLPFTLTVLPHGAPLPPLQDIAVAFVSADLPQFHGLCKNLHRQQIPIVAALELDLQNRLALLRLEEGLGPLRKLRRAIWLRANERRLRQTFPYLAGVQFNGFPARDSYAALVRHPHLYLDNRMADAMMVTDAELAAQAARLRQGAPLRLIHSGRLEPLKGVQQLLPLMHRLDALGVPATLDIYGSGSLSAQIAAGAGDFAGRLRLHGPVDFAEVLVPTTRAHGDIFLATHQQSDPSCSYLEAMGCGLNVAGYDNAMWRGLYAEVGAGAVAPMGDVDALALAIQAYHNDRDALVNDIACAAKFARAHSFEAEFKGRMDHLRRAISQL